MGGKSRKDLKAQYMQREAVGGVYAIRNTLTGRVLVGSSVDLRSSINRFTFSQQTGSCIELALQGDWSRQNGEHFVFETLEELKQDENQTAAGFRADVDLLKEMWLEKMSDVDMY